MARLEKLIIALLICGVLAVCGLSIGRYVHTTLQSREAVPYGVPLVYAEILGDGETGFYHLSNSEDAGFVNSEFGITFQSTKQAQASGFRPCPICFSDFQD